MEQKKKIVYSTCDTRETVMAQALKQAKPLEKEQKKLTKLLEGIPAPKLEFLDTLPSREALDKMVEVLKEGQKLIEATIFQTLEWFEEREKDTPDEMRLTAPLVREERNRLNSLLRGTLNEVNQILYKGKLNAGRLTNAYLEASQRIVWMAIGKFGPKRSQNLPELVNRLERLVNWGYLEENSQGPFQVAKKSFALPVELQPSELAEVKAAFEEALRAYRQVERLARMETRKALLKAENLDRKRFFGQEEGFKVIECPSLRQVEPETQKEIFHPGATILVKKNSGGKIYLQEAIGPESIVRAVRELREMNIYFSLKDLLERERSPFVPSLTKEQGGNFTKIWYLLKRGILREKEIAEREELEEELGKLASLKPEEFFLEGKEGIVLAKYNDPKPWTWKSPDGKVVEIEAEKLFFLVERRRGENQNFIQLKDVPPWLKEFFSDCQGEYPEGEKFRGLPLKLGVILRTIWNEVYRHAQIEK